MLATAQFLPVIGVRGGPAGVNAHAILYRICIELSDGFIQLLLLVKKSKPTSPRGVPPEKSPDNQGLRRARPTHMVLELQHLLKMYPINRMNDGGTEVQVRSPGAMMVVEREGVLVRTLQD